MYGEGSLPYLVVASVPLGSCEGAWSLHRVVLKGSVTSVSISPCESVPINPCKGRVPISLCEGGMASAPSVHEKVVCFLHPSVPVKKSPLVSLCEGAMAAVPISPCRGGVPSVPIPVK